MDVTVLKEISRLALLDDETVREGRYSQHVKQCRFRRSDFVTDLDEMNLVLQVQTRDVQVKKTQRRETKQPLVLKHLPITIETEPGAVKISLDTNEQRSSGERRTYNHRIIFPL